MTKPKKTTPLTKQGHSPRAGCNAEGALGTTEDSHVANVTDPVFEVDPPIKSPTKIAQVLELLHSDDGATLDHLIATTGWLPHTARAMLSGLRKQGCAITSTKADGPRVYRIIKTKGDAA